MIRLYQVIVDGLWHANEADIAADSLGVAGQFADRIHGIISPDIEEIADAMLLKFLEKLWIHCVLQTLRQLVPAGAKICAWRGTYHFQFICLV